MPGCESEVANSPTWRAERREVVSVVKTPWPSDDQIERVGAWQSDREHISELILAVDLMNSRQRAVKCAKTAR